MADADQLALFGTPQTGRTSDDYWTPAYLFDLMGVRFDLDVACPPGGAPWVPADAYYDQESDGLRSPWWGRVWMNPPYSQATPWVHKFLQHGNGIALLPTAKSRWFNILWESPASLVSLPSSFRFAQGTIFLPTVLAALGAENIEAITKVGRPR